MCIDIPDQNVDSEKSNNLTQWICFSKLRTLIEGAKVQLDKEANRFL